MAIIEAIKDRTACPDILGATTPHGGTSHWFYVPDKDVRDKIARIEGGKDLRIESKAYQHVVYDDSELPNIKARMKAVYEEGGVLTTEPKILDKDGQVAAPVKATSDGYYDIQALKSAGLFDDSAQDEGRPHKVIDGTVSKSTLDSAVKRRVVTKELNPISAIDKAAITGGSVTLAPTGADYVNVLAVKNDLNNLTEDLLMTIIDTITETASAEFTQNFSTYDVTLTANFNHYGNPNNKVAVKADFDGFLFRFSPGTFSGNIYVNNLYVYRNVALATAYDVFGCYKNGVTGTIWVSDNTIKEIPGSRGRIMSFNADALAVRVYNNLIFGTDKHVTGIYVNAGNTDSKVENNVLLGANSDIIGSSLAHTLIQNNYAACYTDCGSVATFEKNASEDASGNVGYQNLTAADQFVSVTEGDGNDFLMASPDGLLNNAGNAPAITGHTKDIAGRSISSGTTPIGAKKYYMFNGLFLAYDF